MDVTERATDWVDAWINRHVKTRVLDGRPGKMFRDALIKDITQLIEASSGDHALPQRKGIRTKTNAIG